MRITVTTFLPWNSSAVRHQNELTLILYMQTLVRFPYSFSFLEVLYHVKILRYYSLFSLVTTFVYLSYATAASPTISAMQVEYGHESCTSGGKVFALIT